jgi:hypothetical protein
VNGGATSVGSTCEIRFAAPEKPYWYELKSIQFAGQRVNFSTVQESPASAYTVTMPTGLSCSEEGLAALQWMMTLHVAGVSATPNVCKP